jgi:hypothetical protein
MRRLFSRYWFAAWLLLLHWSPLQAAPLLVGENQAQDAVALLREWGLIEGYPDQNFKGDRATSRYEAAMVLARTLQMVERRDADYLTKHQQATLQGLTEEFASELAAMGVRVDELTNEVEQLEVRVEEQERLFFSGEFVSRFVGQSFTNQGRHNSGPGGVNYDEFVGSVTGANFLPINQLGILPVIDYTSGRPLTNGTGFTSTLFLDINFLLDNDWEGDLRMFAHSSAGSSVVDALWGTSPPYLANPFTGTVNLADGQGRNRTPFTTAGFESLDVTNGPLLFTVGRFEQELLNPAVYLGPVNPAFHGPALLGNFGFRGLADFDPITVEVFGTKLPDGNPAAGGPGYDTDALSGAVQYRNSKLTLTGNFLRAENVASGGLPLAVGQTSAFNGLAGEFYANWVNPKEYLVGGLGGVGSPNVAGKGSLTDTRPVPGVPNSDSFGAAATIGPQAQTSAGLSVVWQEENWTILGDYALSSYRPNKNSSFKADDSLWRMGFEVDLFEDAVKLGLEYRYTGSRYDPFVLTFPTTATGTAVFRAYHRLPDFNQFWHMYFLHNSADYPRNRQGFWLDTSWRYHPDGIVAFAYRNLSQAESSLQDVRLPVSSLGPFTPDVKVLGHSPGFLDVVFRGYSPLSFDGNLNPLEDHTGQVTSFAVEAHQVFTGTPWRADLEYERWNFHRPSELSANLGGSQNLVDFYSAVGSLSVGRTFGQDVLVTVGYERAEMKGHYDPFGVYNPYAITNNSTDFVNRDTVQHIPLLRTDWQVAANTNVSLEYRQFFTRDRVEQTIGAGNIGGPNSLAHPFEWDGYQLSTEFSLKF